ncbi:MAG: hypothetical protein V4689_04640 [Verrucomicrobiota bacterium]
MDQDEKKARNAGGWLIVGLLLAVVYVLSIGPATRWAMKHSHSDEALLTYYPPVYWLWSNTPLREPIDRYVRWWCR